MVGGLNGRAGVLVPNPVVLELGLKLEAAATHHHPVGAETVRAIVACLRNAML